MQNETLVASAVKVTAVNSGAALSMLTNTGTISTVAGILAATYSAVQIFKALPWITDYVIAIKSGISGNWSHWHRIAKTEEKSNGDDVKP